MLAVTLVKSSASTCECRFANPSSCERQEDSEESEETIRRECGTSKNHDIKLAHYVCVSQKMVEVREGKEAGKAGSGAVKPWSGAKVQHVLRLPNIDVYNALPGTTSFNVYLSKQRNDV